MKHFLIVGLLIATRCVAATYYVSPTGLDSNSGTSPETPWLTLAHVNARTFAPGDAIYLQRGGTWNEPLIVPSSGTSGNPISFDAYGTGPAPVLTAAAPPLTWTYNSGNVWAAQLPAAPTSATVLTMQFGSLWGQYKAPSTTCLTAGVIVNSKDFCSYAGYVYVYDSSSTNGPAAFYGTTITPILTVATGYQLISVNNKQWLTFQHLKLQNFDSIGVLVWAASDNLVFANMEVDGMVPNSTNPLGFYISATSPASIKLYNVDAHLNYDGFKIAGTAASSSAISLVNCSAFGNRDAAIVDNVPGGSAVVTYSHFYGNNISTLWGQDVQGVAGPSVSSATNIGTLVNITLNQVAAEVPNYVDPQIASVGRYAAWDTFTVDDVGLAQPADDSDGVHYTDTEAYVNRNVLPAFNLYGLKFNAAVTTGYAGYTSAVDTVSVQNWFNQGHGINSHSWSHQYFTPVANLNAFTLLYNGTGTATISGNHLTTSVTGGTGSSIASLDLTAPPYNEVSTLVTYLKSLPGYTATQTTIRDVVHTVGLADVAAQSISGSPLQFVFDTQRMETDEMSTSMAWLNSQIAGLTETYYVTPDGQENNATQGYALSAGYTGERGELAMHGFLGGAWGTDEVASKGVGLMNIVSFGMVGWHTNTAAQMDEGIDSLMFRQKLWGYPIGLYIHMPDFTGTQIFQTLAGLTSHGSTVKLNTELRDWMLASWTTIPNTTPGGAFFQLPQSGAAFSAARTVLSPDIGAGQDLGAPWNYDINGVQRTGAWDIGAYQMENATLGGGTSGGYSVLGGGNYARLYISSTTTANPGNLTPLFTGTLGVNQTGYDTTYNAPPLDCITRVTDSTTIPSGKGIGNNTWSGGSNDLMWSKNGTWLAFSDPGGGIRILHLDLTGNCSQVVNTGTLNTWIPGPFSWSRVTDNVFYTVVNYTQLKKCTMTSDSTWTCALLVDVASGTGAPGLPTGTYTTGGILTVGLNDQYFGWILGNAGGQNTAQWGVVVDTSTIPPSAAVVNEITGSYWTSTNSGTPTTPPTGTLSTATTCTSGTDCSCWLGPSPAPGEHDAQMSLDGKFLVISYTTNGPSVTAQRGACTGLTSGVFSIWQVGTQYTQFGNNYYTGPGGLWMGGHASTGVSNELNTYPVSALKNTIHPFSNVINFTQYQTGTTISQNSHMFWPHPTGDDTYPAIEASYNLPPTGGTGCLTGAATCPPNLANTIYAEFPNEINRARVIFANTFSCAGNGDCLIPTGADWSAGTVYTLNPTVSIVTPVVGNAGNYSFETKVAGTGATVAPTWTQTVGASVTDGGATLINIGVAGAGENNLAFNACNDIIISVSQDGNYAAFPSTMLTSLGLDYYNGFRCDLFVIHLQ